MTTKRITPLGRYFKPNTKPYLIEDYSWFDTTGKASYLSTAIKFLTCGNLWKTMYVWNQSFTKKFEYEIMDAR